MFKRPIRKMHRAMDRESIRYHHTVFPDLQIAGRRHRIDFGAAERAARPIDGLELSSVEADFVAWLFRQAGLEVGIYRPQGLKRRLPSLLRVLRTSDVEQVRSRIERDARLLDAALSVMIIGVTRLFRDVTVFEDLRERLLEMTSCGQHTFRVLSVGCSDGAELYSVAMLLASHDVLHRCVLTGIDCRRDALRIAATGIFGNDAMSDVPPVLKARYCVPATGGRWRMIPSLVSAIRWQVGDAVSVRRGETYDLILCRNLAIYLEQTAIQALWENLGRLLALEGLLMVGRAERPALQHGQRHRHETLKAVAPCLYTWAGR